MWISTLEQTIGNKTIYPQIYWFFFLILLLTGVFPSPHLLVKELIWWAMMEYCLVFSWQVLGCVDGSLWGTWFFSAWVENHRIIKAGKDSSRWLSPTFNMTLPGSPLSRVPKHHLNIFVFFEHFQEQWFHHFPGQPVFMFDHPSSEKIFCNIQLVRES